MSFQFTGGVSYGAQDGSWLINDSLVPLGGPSRTPPTWAECMARARAMPIVGTAQDVFERPAVKLRALEQGPVLVAAAGTPSDGFFEALARGVRNWWGS